MERRAGGYQKKRKYFKEYFDTPDSSERGRKNQQRALQIVQAMVEQNVYLKVKRASHKQDRMGVDFWVYPNFGDRVPVQIKSSGAEAKNFRQKLSDPHSIAIVVVNEWKSDDEIREEVARSVRIWTTANNTRYLGLRT